MAKHIFDFYFYLSVYDMEKLLNIGVFIRKYQAKRQTTTPCLIRLGASLHYLFYLFSLSFLHGNTSPFQSQSFARVLPSTFDRLQG
jgi:hypothetical protein